MKHLCIVIFFLSFLNVFAQEVPDFDAVDSLYREDQFYFGVTYNIFSKKPQAVSQNSFSTGLNLGFLRDFPINKMRTVAVAPGLGFSFNNYKQNMIVQEINGTRNYSVISPETSFDKNKLAMLFIDVPIEFRWRTSTFDSHKFWRVYTGFKTSYLVYSRSRYKASGIDYKIDNNPDINKLQYGAYVTAGWNQWNFYAYYGLQNIFKRGALNNQPIEINTLNFGLMFYIL